MNDAKKKFIKFIENFRYRHHIYDVFRDFCEVSAIMLSNAACFSGDREKRYLEIIKRYSREEAEIMAKMFACVVAGLEMEYFDFLGNIFSELELHSHWKGQFFTPYSVSKALAMMILADAEKVIDEQGFLTICEPACGAGSMVIACADVLREKGINYQTKCHVTAIDVCPTAVHMTYIQSTLLHIPAVVYIGNTLSLEVRDAFFTLAHVMGNWSVRLRKRRGSSNVQFPIPETPLQMGLL